MGRDRHAVFFTKARCDTEHALQITAEHRTDIINEIKKPSQAKCSHIKHKRQIKLPTDKKSRLICPSHNHSMHNLR